MTDEMITSTAELRQLHQARISAKNAEWQQMLAEDEVRSVAQSVERERIIGHAHRATPHEYGRWLARYLATGRQPTHFYDYPMSRGSFYTLDRSVDLTPLFGANHLCLIVPAGMTAHGEPGHTNLFLMDYPEMARHVPVYTDSVVEAR